MGLAITPLSPHLGAEVRGIDLARPVDAATRERLNRAFVEHSVLAIRGQKLTPPQLLSAAQLFGEVFPQHNSRFALADCPLVHYLSNQDFFPDGRRYIPGEGYHTDHSNDAMPPKATVLHAVQLPDTGGDTQYVNMCLAYDELPEATRRRIDGLKAVHVYQSRHSARKLMGLSAEAQARVPRPSSTRWCAPTPRPAARRSTSTRSASTASSAWKKAKRSACSTNCSRTRPRRNTSTAIAGSLATWCYGTTAACCTRRTATTTCARCGISTG